MTDAQVQQQVQDILHELRPAVMADGGDIQFVSYKDGIVYVKLLGACVGCPASFYTLKLGVEQAVKKQLPFVTAVEAIDNE